MAEKGKAANGDITPSALFLTFYNLPYISTFCGHEIGRYQCFCLILLFCFLIAGHWKNELSRKKGNWN